MDLCWSINQWKTDITSSQSTSVTPRAHNRLRTDGNSVRNNWIWNRCKMLLNRLQDENLGWEAFYHCKPKHNTVDKSWKHPISFGFLASLLTARIYLILPVSNSENQPDLEENCKLHIKMWTHCVHWPPVFQKTDFKILLFHTALNG